MGGTPNSGRVSTRPERELAGAAPVTLESWSATRRMVALEAHLAATYGEAEAGAIVDDDQVARAWEAELPGVPVAVTIEALGVGIDGPAAAGQRYVLGCACGFSRVMTADALLALYEHGGSVSA